MGGSSSWLRRPVEAAHRRSSMIGTISRAPDYCRRELVDHCDRGWVEPSEVVVPNSEHNDLFVRVRCVGNYLPRQAQSWPAPHAPPTPSKTASTAPAPTDQHRSSPRV